MTTNPKLSHKSLSILSNYDKTFRTISENCFRFYSVLFHVYLYMEAKTFYLANFFSSAKPQAYPYVLLRTIYALNCAIIFIVWGFQRSVVF